MSAAAPYVAELKPESVSKIIFCVVVILSIIATIIMTDPEKKSKKV